MLELLQQSLAVRVAVTVGIVAAGVAVGHGAGRLVQMLWQREAPDAIGRVQQRARTPGQIVRYGVWAVTLVVAMVYINASVATGLLSRIAGYVPRTVTAVLLVLLGVIIVRGVLAVVRLVVTKMQVLDEAAEMGVSAKVVSLFVAAVQVFLYLLVVELALIQLGASPTLLNSTLTAAAYGVVVLLVLLGFYGFRDLVKDYAAGIYLRSAEVMEPGKRVKIGDEAGEIREIKPFNTMISTDSGYFMLSPNAHLMGRNVLFKRVRAEIETLEDIKDFFVTEDAPYQGAASAEMSLAMFGFNISQGDLSEEIEDDTPAALGRAVETLTDEEVRAAVVDADKVTDLGDECKVWFNNEALLLPYFDKTVLFPGTEQEEHYALCVGVEGEELLLIDPTTGETGGVYYVDAAELGQAMAAADSGGYLVVAPRGTTGYWRIKNDLIYSSLSLYQQLSKSLEVQLNKILRRGEVLRFIVPDTVEEFVEQWRDDRGRSVTRMWSPERGDAKLDEFTDSGG